MIITTDTAKEIVQLIADDALPALIDSLLIGNLVHRDFDPAVARLGNTIDVLVPPTMVAVNMVRGATAKLNNLSLGEDAKIDLTGHYTATFQLPDITKALVSPAAREPYVLAAALALAECIEADLLKLYSRFSVNSPLSAMDTTGYQDLVDSVETTLFVAKVPAHAPVYMVVDPPAYEVFRKLPRFKECSPSNSIKSFLLLRSLAVPKTGVLTHGIAFAKGAIGFVSRRLPAVPVGFGAVSAYAETDTIGIRAVMSYNPEETACQITIDILCGCGVLRNEFGVQVNY